MLTCGILQCNCVKWAQRNTAKTWVKTGLWDIGSIRISWKFDNVFWVDTGVVWGFLIWAGVFNSNF